MTDAGKSSPSTGLNSGAAYKLTSLLIVFAVFILLLIIFVFIIFVYTRRDSGIRSNARRRRWRRSETRVRFFVSASNTPATAAATGLESSVLSSLPVSIYRSSDFKEASECAVCLTDLADGEKARFLPICGHGFHLDCIDMWFHSHITCPICRCPVANGGLPELPHLPAGGSEMLSIAIPVRSAETVLSSPSSGLKSPAEEVISPALARVISLRRILSRGKKIGGSASVSSPRVPDIESGMVRVGSGKSNGGGS